MGLVFIVLIFLFAGIGDATHAKESEVHYSGTWPTVSLSNIPIYTKAGITGEVYVIPLMTANFNSASPIIVGANLTKRFNKNIAVSAGIEDWGLKMLEGKKRDNQLQPYVQILPSMMIKDLKVSGRIRFITLTNDEFHNISIRNRTRIALTHPLPHIGTFNHDKSIYVIGSEEIHINLNDKKPDYRLGFEENFVFLGIGKIINKHMKVETGYYMLYTNTNAKSPNKIHHLFGVNINFNF